MALNDDAVLTAARGYIYLANQDTVSPTDTVVEDFTPAVPGLAVGWTNVGHTSRDDLPEFGFDGGDTETKGTWQNEALKQVVTEVSVDFMTFNLLQLDHDTLSMYYGVTNGAAEGAKRFTAMTNPGTNLPTKALLIIVVDGDTNVAFYAPRASLRREDGLSLAVDEFGVLPMRATFLGGNVTEGLFSWIGGEIESPDLTP